MVGRDEPGRYVFKLADNQADRPIVQIFTEDQREIVATVLAIPAYRLKPTDDTLITFQFASDSYLSRYPALVRRTLRHLRSRLR